MGSRRTEWRTPVGHFVGAGMDIHARAGPSFFAAPLMFVVSCFTLLNLFHLEGCEAPRWIAAPCDQLGRKAAEPDSPQFLCMASCNCCILKSCSAN